MATNGQGGQGQGQDVAKAEYEKDMAHLVKCVGILFGIQDKENKDEDGTTTISTTFEGRLIPRPRKLEADTDKKENQPKLPYKKGSIAKIFKNLGYSVEIDNLDNKRPTEAIPESTIDDSKSISSTRLTGDSRNFNFERKAPMPGQAQSISSKGVRKNFTPPRPIQRHFSSPRNMSGNLPAIADSEPTKSGGSNHLNEDALLNAFCKKLRANPGSFQNNLPAYNRKQDIDSSRQGLSVDSCKVKDDREDTVKLSSFKSAYEQMIIDDKVRGIKRPRLPPPGTSSNVHVSGLRRMPRADNDDSAESLPKKVPKTGDPENASDSTTEVQKLMLDERLKNVDAKMVEAILNEIIEIGANTAWDDIAGLDGPKKVIMEIIIWPMLRPDIFSGLRGPPKGVLLFGPPGTGKTMIGRLVATQSKSTFFNISASSLTSKWIGDGEKMVRALFQVARVKQPAVIFIDEIDSILTQRSDTEHESSRRLKTEFLIQFDGCATATEDRILVIGVTNRPQELDEAARRRLVKRIYIPLPDTESRKHLVKHTLTTQNVDFELSEEDYEHIAQKTDGYSGADCASLVKEAAFGPIRELSQAGIDIEKIDAAKVRPIQIKDFDLALKRVKSSVAPQDLLSYEEWDKQFGCQV